MWNGFSFALRRRLTEQLALNNLETAFEGSASDFQKMARVFHAGHFLLCKALSNATCMRLQNGALKPWPLESR